MPAKEINITNPFKKGQFKEYTAPLYLGRYVARMFCPFAISFNPYMGCDHGCVCCFANSMQEAKHTDFGKIRTCNAEKISVRISKSIRGKLNDRIAKVLQMRVPLKIGTMTDAFQPMEKTYRTTLGVLRALNREKYPVIINTKGVMMADDPYLSLLRSMPSVVQFSISTPTNITSKAFEPGAPLTSHRFDAMRKLSDSGVNTQVRIAPMIPGISDDIESLESIISKAYSSGAKDVLFSYLKINKTEKMVRALSRAVGCDNYLDWITHLGYETMVTGTEVRVVDEVYIAKILEVKRICDKYNMGCYPGYNILNLHPWKSCCGVERYQGFENLMNWVLMVRGWKIKDHTTFAEYIRGSGCPYTADFKRKWDKGQYEGLIAGLVFNPEDKTYSRVPPAEWSMYKEIRDDSKASRRK